MRYLIAFSLIILLAVPACAQSSISEKGYSAGRSIDFDNDGLDSQPGASETTRVEDQYAGQYLEPTPQNLSKLYLSKGIASIDNDAVIDNYLRINECDIYSRFYQDDFEWRRIRNSARDVLKETVPTFSNKFQIIVPIDLGRYDLERKGFPLINGTAFMDLRRVEIGGNSLLENVCGIKGNIPYFPRNVILILSKPFSYTFLELDEHIAQAFIVRRKYEGVKRPPQLENKEFNRLAFARMRVRFNEFHGTTTGVNNEVLAIMFGTLEGIDVFEDFGEERLLNAKVFN